MLEEKNLLKNYIKKNKLSHAYLFQTDYSFDNMDLVYKFIKEIFFINKNEKEKLLIRKQIDDKSFSDLIEIVPNGSWIKKEQILDLKNSFSVSSTENDVRIYLIHEADKLNDSSANTLLKFLEEPDYNIIGILLTNNIHNVIDTITSRCQVINIKTDYKFEFNDNYENICSFLWNIIKEKDNIYINLNEYYDMIDTKEKIQDALKIFLIILYDVFYFKLFKKYKYIEINEYILSIEKKTTIDEISKFISNINNLIEYSKYNLNSNLLIDRMIILMGGGL